jgi:hypothetical protein
MRSLSPLAIRVGWVNVDRSDGVERPYFWIAFSWVKWELGEVAQRYDDCKTILHPELGRIDVDAQVLFTENRAQTLVVLMTRPGTESHSKLELLSVVGQQQLTP